ncbi:MAG: DUF6880 family protein [Cyanobium sp.]
MAGKRTLNARNLEALGAPALAALLLEVSGGSAVIQRRLRLALAAAEGAGGAAQEVRKRLAAIARATTFVDARKRKALLADLAAQHQVIVGPIAAAAPDQAFQLLVRFLELADGVMERCSDSTGAVLGVFQQAASDLGERASAAEVAPETLAEHVAELIAGNGYGQYDELIPALRDALGQEGLLALQRHFRDIGGPDASYALLQIAEGLGDVDAYLAQFDARQLGWPSSAADVALHLLAAGRASQALTILDGAAAAAASGSAPEWVDARLRVLEALGLSEDAQKLRWQCFCRTLSTPHLRAYLQRLEAFEDVEVEERALRMAEEHPTPLLGLRFLVEWPALPRAARHVLAHAQAWDGETFEIHSHAAERLSRDHPLAATLLLRAMVVFALSIDRAKRYRHVAEHLRSCERLAAAIDDWQGWESHASFSGRLREAFALKRGFWQLLER